MVGDCYHLSHVAKIGHSMLTSSCRSRGGDGTDATEILEIFALRQDFLLETSTIWYW